MTELSEAEQKAVEVKEADVVTDKIEEEKPTEAEPTKVRYIRRLVGWVGCYTMAEIKLKWYTNKYNFNQLSA